MEEPIIRARDLRLQHRHSEQDEALACVIAHVVGISDGYLQAAV
jgi:hypothetical protein